MIPFKLIYQGWKNYLLDLISDIKYKKIFDERKQICNECECNKLGICDKCGCIIKAKTMAEDSKCPLNKWTSINETKIR